MRFSVVDVIPKILLRNDRVAKLIILRKVCKQHLIVNDTSTTLSCGGPFRAQYSITQISAKMPLKLLEIKIYIKKCLYSFYVTLSLHAKE